MKPALRSHPTSTSSTQERRQLTSAPAQTKPQSVHALTNSSNRGVFTCLEVGHMSSSGHRCNNAYPGRISHTPVIETHNSLLTYLNCSKFTRKPTSQCVCVSERLCVGNSRGGNGVRTGACTRFVCNSAKCASSRAHLHPLHRSPRIFCSTLRATIRPTHDRKHAQNSHGDPNLTLTGEMCA